MRFIILVLLLFPSGSASAGALSNWTAAFTRCGRHAELVKDGPMDIGVRFATDNPTLAQAFRSAMDFWSTIIEMKWHEDDTDTCAMELGDGLSNLFEAAPDTMAARSQFPDRPGFYGWIAFNPRVRLDSEGFYRISVHEIGHVFGLQHSTHIRSLMYAFDLDCSNLLDAADLSALATRHRLRLKSLSTPILLTAETEKQAGLPRPRTAN